MALLPEDTVEGAELELQAGGRGMDPDEIARRYHVVPNGPSIIVVGPDGVGKTTVVAHLSRILGVPAFKCPSEKQIFRTGGRQSLVFDYTLTKFLGQTGYRFVSDRGYPCEWVYSKVFRRETDPVLLEWIDAGHHDLGTRILHLYSSVPPTRVDDLVPPERYYDVSHVYHSFMEWTSCQVHSFDTKDMLAAYQEGGDVSEEFTRNVIYRMELWRDDEL